MVNILPYYLRGLEKLGDPDYEGDWHAREYKSDFDSGSFSMYILKRHPTGLLTPEKIEGVIVDSVGLAIFSGERARKGIEFVKSYSPSLKRGTFNFANDLLYRGVINEDGTIEGEYVIAPGDASVANGMNLLGTFRMAPVIKPSVKTE